MTNHEQTTLRLFDERFSHGDYDGIYTDIRAFIKERERSAVKEAMESVIRMAEGMKNERIEAFPSNYDMRDQLTQNRVLTQFASLLRSRISEMGV